MQCPQCGSQVNPGAKFCGTCGAALAAPPPRYPGQGPVNYGTQAGYGTETSQYEQYGSGMPGYNEPRPEVSNPKGPIRLGDMTITIEGELVPVVNVELGTQQTIYFEHHILLWKHPGVQIGFKGIKGAAKRFFAGLQIFISEAAGPGNIAFSRESVGQIVALRIQPGQEIDVREHQFLLASSNVDYGFTFVQGAANILFSRTGLFVDRFTGRNDEGILLLHGYGNVFEKTLAPGETIDVEPGGWLWKDASVQMTTTTVMGSTRGGLFGALGNIVGGISFILNRFTGPGRLGIQSMTYHPPTPEGAQQVGGTSNIMGTLGQLFNS
jgi:uncharacterized protein (AIM24 family)